MPTIQLNKRIRTEVEEEEVEVRKEWELNSISMDSHSIIVPTNCCSFKIRIFRVDWVARWLSLSCGLSSSFLSLLVWTVLNCNPPIFRIFLWSALKTCQMLLICCFLMILPAWIVWSAADQDKRICVCAFTFELHFNSSQFICSIGGRGGTFPFITPESSFIRLEYVYYYELSGRLDEGGELKVSPIGYCCCCNQTPNRFTRPNERGWMDYWTNYIYIN